MTIGRNESTIPFFAMINAHEHMKYVCLLAPGWKRNDWAGGSRLGRNMYLRAICSDRAL